MGNYEDHGQPPFGYMIWLSLLISHDWWQSGCIIYRPQIRAMKIQEMDSPEMVWPVVGMCSLLMGRDLLKSRWSHMIWQRRNLNSAFILSVLLCLVCVGWVRLSFRSTPFLLSSPVYPIGSCVRDETKRHDSPHKKNDEMVLFETWWWPRFVFVGWFGWTGKLQVSRSPRTRSMLS